MDPSSQPARGSYTPTGWRITGSGAGEIVERSSAAAARLRPGTPRETLFALQCTVNPVVRGRPAAELLLEAITDDIRLTWPECPRLLRDEEVARTPSRFGGLRYQVREEPGTEWLGEVIWRSVHPVVAGAPITTRVLLEERSHYTRVNVRVTADEGTFSVRGYVGAGQAQPAFLRALAGEGSLTWMGAPVRPIPLGQGEIADFVESVLAAPERELPVAVLAPTEREEYLVDPEDLAWQLLGRARLYFLRFHDLTFALTDTIGERRMSAYWGAVHGYYPGWSRHDDPMDHPLLVADRLVDPVIRATWLGELGMWLGERVELPPLLDERYEAPEEDEPEEVDEAPAAAAAAAAEAEVVPGSAPGPRESPESSAPPTPAAAAPPATWADPTPLLFRLLADVEKVAGLVRDLADEVERLRTIGAVRSASTSAIERRLGRLEAFLGEALAGDEPAQDATGETGAPDPAAEAEDEGRTTLVEVVEGAAEAHADALVFLDSARTSAAESPFEDPERVRAVLDAMARVARQRRDGALGTSLREAFRDLGVDYRPGIAKSTSGRLREQYLFTDAAGTAVEAVEHIALGGTYDPRRCLRIYFTSRVPTEPRFVIAHVGRHFEVMTST